MYNLEHLAMTNHEPSERARLSTSEHHMTTIPRTTIPRPAESRGNWRLGAIGGFGVLLMLVGIMYAMNERASTTASAPPAARSAPSTVGQGDTSNRPAEDDATPPNQLQK
jgi:hypothetical protein